MRSKASQLVRTATVFIALAAAVSVAGCTSASTKPPVLAASSSPSAEPTVLRPLDCGRLLPVTLASAALGLPASTLFDPTTQDQGDQQPNNASVRLAMQAAATTAGGLVTCSYSAPDNGTGAQFDDGSHRPPNVSVAVLPNAAVGYGLIEPDFDDGLNGLAPAHLGDTAFVACHPPESDSCRAEILVGTTWLSVRVTPLPEDETFTAFAEAVVAAVKTADPVPPIPLTKQVGCDELLSATDLSNAVDIRHAQSTDYGRIPSREAGIGTVAHRNAELVHCGWVTSDAGGASNGVSGMVLPAGKAAWTATMPQSVKNSSIRFAPWAGLGDAAYAGCGGDTCEVVVLSGDVWLSLQHYAQPRGNLEGTKTLAATALANHLASR